MTTLEEYINKIFCKIDRVMCVTEICAYYGPYSRLKLAYGKKLQTLGWLCRKINKKRARESTASKYETRQEASAYSKSIRSRLIIEGTEVESYFGPSPPEP